ncbi:hypothetical protein [Roseitranquillus sediminis]|uniref:hypothetical protein n=1 Tax=Roseitranquillus sediminis TaxID=2809051 RepID=UPI001D0C77C8|nr:hypothetical protein [Roseitranquillus sediminis]MBM9594913.1 hypothetical protein [Roseitranquillus sediminis]
MSLLGLMASLLAACAAFGVAVLFFRRMLGSTRSRQRIYGGAAGLAALVGIVNLAAPFIVEDAFLHGLFAYTGFALVAVWFAIRAVVDLTDEIETSEA